MAALVGQELRFRARRVTPSVAVGGGGSGVADLQDATVATRKRQGGNRRASKRLEC